MKIFSETKHPLAEQIKFLADRDQFLDFLDYIAAGREIAIKSLPRANEGRLREISGRIQAYDEILDICNYQTLLWKRARSSMPR